VQEAFIMSGVAKTISGAGTINFTVLSVAGSATTNTNFSISGALGLMEVYLLRRVS